MHAVFSEQSLDGVQSDHDGCRGMSAPDNGQKAEFGFYQYRSPT